MKNTSNLSTMFKELMDSYSAVYANAFATQNFTHPIRNTVEKHIPAALSKLINNASYYKVQGGTGMGRLARTPWIAIFDTRVTTTARRGVYIVYLLNKDKKELYITLIQAATEIEENLKNKAKTAVSKEEVFDAIKGEAAKIRKYLPTQNFSTDNKIRTGTDNFDAGTICYKKYTLNDLPNDNQLEADLLDFVSLYNTYHDTVFNPPSSEWWPPVSEYHPGISKEQWLALLNTPSVFTDSALQMIAEFYAYGGTATCAQLAEHYHRTYNYYLMTSVHLAERVVKHTHCPTVKEDKNAQNSKWWPILYVGKDASKTDKGTYIWKIRDELYEALTEFNIKPRLVPTTPKTFGVFDSWEIINENTAIKTCDKSFFEHNGSGVPKGICWFFDAENLELGQKLAIQLSYKGQVYNARVANESSDLRRVRIFWSTELGKQFAAFQNTSGAKLVFRKTANNFYEISFEGSEEELSVKDTIAHIKNYIAAKGFSYEDGLIENFYLSLKTKPFVILAGTSGTGKTRLVRLFAEACGATTKNGRYKMVPVRPDWSDSSDLFGHVNLNGQFVPGAIIDFVNQAEWDLEHPYFLCLDEMNLARVEYYLSDILSVIETRDFIDGTITSDPLVSEGYYGTDEEAANKYSTLRLPENLYIIGTVNMDETTFPFSRKVLDRANTIEFSYVDLMPTFDEIPLDNVTALDLPNSFLKTEYLNLIQDCVDEKDLANEYCAELQTVNKVLQKANAHVGYRVRDEIVFYLLNSKHYELLPESAAFDNAIMQKILPRIQGSTASVKEMLCELFKHCAGDYDGYQVQSDYICDKMRKALNDPSKNITYRRSAEKIELMTRRFEEDGFTSYWL